MAKVQVFDENNNPVDLNTIQGWDGEGFSITPGEYVFTIETVTQTQSSNNKPQLELALSIAQGLVTEAHNGQSMKHWLSLTKAAAPRLKNFLDAARLTLDADGGFDDNDLVGKQFIAEVYEDEYQKGINLDGTPKMKTTTKIRKERPVEETVVETAPAPTPLKAVAPAKPVPAKPIAPSLPRVASALPVPGQRIPLPRK